MAEGASAWLYNKLEINERSFPRKVFFLLQNIKVDIWEQQLLEISVWRSSWNMGKILKEVNSMPKSRDD